MSIYGYSITRGKTRFNINLSSYQVNSWTGRLYDAIYSIDLRGHLDSSDFQKEYNVTLSFESESTTNQLLSGTSYAIHLDLGSNKINSHAFREAKTPHFIAYKSFFNLGDGTLYIRFDTHDSDNPPIRVNSLYNLDKIGFNVFNINGQATITSTTLNYQLTLSFEEV